MRTCLRLKALVFVAVFIITLSILFVARAARPKLGAPLLSDQYLTSQRPIAKLNPSLASIVPSTAVDVAWNDACQPSRGGNYTEAGVYSGNTTFLNGSGKLEWKTRVVSNVSGDLYSFGIVQFDRGCGEYEIVPNGFTQTRIYASPGDDIVFRRQADTDGKATWIPFNATTGVEGTEGAIVLNADPATYAGGLQFEICTASFYCARSGHYDYPANPAGTVYVRDAPTPTLTEILPYQSSDYRHEEISHDTTPPVGFEQPGFDDSSWGLGAAAFGISRGLCPLRTTISTPWSPNTDLLVRRQISVPAGASNLQVMIAVDNDIQGVFFNGVQILGPAQHDNCPNRDDFQIDVAQNLVHPGQNVVVYHLRDRGDETFFDTRVIANLSIADNAFLDFPLNGKDPYTATINSVFDHSQDGSVSYGDNGIVTAFTGESGRCNPNNPLQDGRSQVNGTKHYGFRNQLGEPFFINGHYVGGGSNCDTAPCNGSKQLPLLSCSTFLFYDGHPGIDFDAACGTDVYAVVSGTVHYPTAVPGTYKNAYAYHILEIVPDPPYDNYRIYYLHLATHISVDSKHIVPCVDELPLIQEGQHVTGGVSVIGRVGSAGVSKNGRGKHLHFEVHILNRGTGIPVDPYGWTGGYADPYTRASNKILWK